MRYSTTRNLMYQPFMYSVPTVCLPKCKCRKLDAHSLDGILCSLHIDPKLTKYGSHLPINSRLLEMLLSMRRYQNMGKNQLSSPLLARR
jgi:hypothetical protein